MRQCPLLASVRIEEDMMTYMEMTVFLILFNPFEFDLKLIRIYE